MDVNTLIEQFLCDAVTDMTASPCPPKLAQAIRYAVLPGGARVRPKLVMAVARACTDTAAPLAQQTAVAIELLHCASLVQDDLACFDDAATRRGKPSLHRRFDDRLAILASDALIVGAFERVSSVQHIDSVAQLSVINVLARQVGAVQGITAGQAWESEEFVDTESYHRAKTGALFAAATRAGALAVGADDKAWEITGHHVGRAYQIADDLHDVLSDAATMGKPANVDVAHGRPNEVHRHGLDCAVRLLHQTIEQVIDSVPNCKNADFFTQTIRHEAKRFLPKEIALSAA